MIKRLLLASLFSFAAVPAFAACSNPAPITGNSGAINMSVKAGADTNCQSLMDIDTSSQLHQDLISPPALGAASGGWTTKLLNALSTTVTAVKGSAGWVGKLYCYNPNASVAYIQVFNVVSGSVTLGTTVPAQSYGLGPTAASGFIMPVQGDQYTTAISVAATTTATGLTAPSTAVDCNMSFN